MKSFIQLSLIVVLATTVNVQSQPDSVLIKHYTFGDYDICSAICETDDGGFLLAGNNGNGGLLNILKTDQDGDSLWSVRGPNCHLRKTIIKTDDGGFVFAGYVGMGRETGWNDLILFRLNENGDTVWSRTYGAGIHESEHCYDMLQTQAGGYALAGFTHTFDYFNYDLLLQVTDENGDSLWSRTYSMPPCRTMLQLDDGGYLLAGWNYLLRTDENGDSLWSITPSFNFVDLLRTDDGGIIVAGNLTGPDNYTTLLTKLTQNCDTLWSKSCDYFTSNDLTVIESEDRGLLVAGTREGDVLAIRTDENGDTLWCSSFYGGHAGCTSVIETSEGGFVFGGYIEIPSVDSAGNRMNFLFIRSSDEPFSIENPFDPLPPGQVDPEEHFSLEKFSLSAFPNPFNSSTTINYSLSSPGRYAIDVIDIQGRLVTRLSDRWKVAGSYREVFDAGATPGGAYVLRLISSRQSREIPLILTK